jgi:hypothetical protein
MNSLFQNRHFYPQARLLSREKFGAFARSYFRRHVANVSAIMTFPHVNAQ